MTHHRHRGFTLIEVLIALLVIALGVGALLSTLTSSADTVAQLRDRSIAEWLALNRISEVRLSATRPGVGVSSGTVDNYAGGRWSWQQTVSDPGMAGILRVEVKVAPMTAASTAATTAPTGDATQASSNFPALATAYGFLGTSVAPPTGVDPDWSLAAAATGGGAGTGTGTGAGGTSGGNTPGGTGSTGGATKP